MIPVPVMYAALGFVGVFGFLAAVFSWAAAKGFVFHSCGGGSEFYCNTCPGQYKCPGIELGTELSQKMAQEKGEKR